MYACMLVQVPRQTAIRAHEPGRTRQNADFVSHFTDGKSMQRSLGPLLECKVVLVTSPVSSSHTLHVYHGSFHLLTRLLGCIESHTLSIIFSMHTLA